MWVLNFSSARCVSVVQCPRAATARAWVGVCAREYPCWSVVLSGKNCCRTEPVYSLTPFFPVLNGNNIHPPPLTHSLSHSHTGVCAHTHTRTQLHSEIKSEIDLWSLISSSPFHFAWFFSSLFLWLCREGRFISEGASLYKGHADSDFFFILSEG